MTSPHNQREHDLAILAAGDITGWWDHTGQPAPWPEDLFDPDTEWRPSTDNPPAPLAPGEQPF
jgi:ketosteroid isomerase-like protein